MVLCEAGVGVGEHRVPLVSQLWAQEHGQALGPWERWFIMAAEIQLLQKMGLLPAPPPSAHPIVVLFLLVCHSCIHVLPRASFLDLVCTNR